MVVIAAAVVVAFVSALYFITHRKVEEIDVISGHKVTGNGLPPKPEERWRYIKELENRQTGVRSPTEPTAGGEVLNSRQLTNEQRQLLEQMQSDMRQQPTQLSEVPWNEQTTAEEMPHCHYRLQGYVQALRRNGIEVDPHYIARGDFTFEAGSDALEQLMAQPQPPTAIFCHTDVMALGAISCAKRRGLRVPEDLSIMGFDDIALSKFCDPPLTTVAQPRFNIGKEAMLLLLDQLQGQTVSNGSRLLDCVLVERGSTSAPGKGK